MRVIRTTRPDNGGAIIRFEILDVEGSPSVEFHTNDYTSGQQIKEAFEAWKRENVG